MNDDDYIYKENGKYLYYDIENINFTPKSFKDEDEKNAYTKKIMDTYLNSKDSFNPQHISPSLYDYTYGVDWGEDVSKLSEEQERFINTLLKTTDFMITQEGVEFLKMIKYAGDYTEDQAKILNGIRDRYIKWLQNHM